MSLRNANITLKPSPRPETHVSLPYRYLAGLDRKCPGLRVIRCVRMSAISWPNSSGSSSDQVTMVMVFTGPLSRVTRDVPSGWWLVDRILPSGFNFSFGKDTYNLLIYLVSCGLFSFPKLREPP